MKIDEFGLRLKQVLADIGELEGVLEEVSQKQISNSSDSVDSMHKLRVSGFMGYHLAQEGIALINLIGICLVGSPERQKDFEYVAKVKPLLENASKSMEMYKTITSKEIIERAIQGS